MDRDRFQLLIKANLLRLCLPSAGRAGESICGARPPVKSNREVRPGDASSEQGICRRTFSHPEAYSNIRGWIMVTEMNDGFRARLRERQTLIGTIVSSTDPATAEVLAECGFDWLFIDAEHGPFETTDLLPVLRAVDHRIPCVVRVPSVEEIPIKKALDIGASGIIAPQTNTVDQVESVVRFARYTPQGSRGVGLARATGYGLRLADYVGSANDKVAVIVQAEHIDAVENIEAIVKVEGVDAVFIGPYDLSASMGKMGDVADPAVVDAINHVTSICDAAEMPLGIFGVTAESVKPYLDRGYSLIASGVDVLMMAHAAKKMLSKLRSAEG